MCTGLLLDDGVVPVCNHWGADRRRDGVGVASSDLQEVVMPVSFILAGICFIVTCTTTLLVIYAYGMSDNPSQSGTDMRPLAIGVFAGGTVISLLIAFSHYIHLHW
jgi:hypothetical protein